MTPHLNHDSKVEFINAQKSQSKSQSSQCMNENTLENNVAIMNGFPVVGDD